ncbi:hypothetical protein ACJJTC_018624 [Scirpophaga incertulas]
MKTVVVQSSQRAHASTGAPPKQATDLVWLCPEPVRCYLEPVRRYREPVRCYLEPVRCYLEPVAFYPEPVRCYPKLVRCYPEPVQCYLRRFGFTDSVRARSPPPQASSYKSHIYKEPSAIWAVALNTRALDGAPRKGRGPCPAAILSRVYLEPGRVHQEEVSRSVHSATVV